MVSNLKTLTKKSHQNPVLRKNKAVTKLTLLIQSANNTSITALKKELSSKKDTPSTVTAVRMKTSTLCSWLVLIGNRLLKMKETQLSKKNQLITNPTISLEEYQSMQESLESLRLLQFSVVQSSNQVAAAPSIATALLLKNKTLSTALPWTSFIANQMDKVTGVLQLSTLILLCKKFQLMAQELWNVIDVPKDLANTWSALKPSRNQLALDSKEETLSW